MAGAAVGGEGWDSGNGGERQPRLTRWYHGRMTTIPRTRKKLREARFFLGELRRRSALATAPDTEEFHYYLSAFLSAGRSVTFFVQKEDKSTYDSVEPIWRSTFSAEDQELYRFMNRQRVAELHTTGADYQVGSAFFEIKGGIYEDESCKIICCDPPGVSPGGIYKRTREFEIGGTRQEVVEAFEKYVALLDGLLHKIEEAQSIPSPDHDETKVKRALPTWACWIIAAAVLVLTIVVAA